MKTGKLGIKLIKEFESLHDGDLKKIGLQPKMDPIGIWTEGYGRAMRDKKGNFLKGIGNKLLAEKSATINTEAQAEKALIEAKNKKVYSIAEKHDLSNDKEMIRKLHSRVWKCLKKRFNVPRYNEIPAIYFNQAKTTINNLSFKDLL